MCKSALWSVLCVYVYMMGLSVFANENLTGPVFINLFGLIQEILILLHGNVQSFENSYKLKKSLFKNRRFYLSVCRQLLT